MPKKVKESDNLVDRLTLWETTCKVPLVLPANPTVIACDPGTANLACCVLHAKGWESSKLSSEPLKTIGARVRWLEEQILRWCLKWKPHVFVKEGLAFRMPNKAGDMGRVQYALERIAIELNIPLITVAPMSAKAFIGALKQKDSNKDTVQLQLYKRYGVEFASSDQADSYLLAKAGLAIATGEYVVGSKPKAKKSRKKKVDE